MMLLRYLREKIGDYTWCLGTFAAVLKPIYQTIRVYFFRK